MKKFLIFFGIIAHLCPSIHTMDPELNTPEQLLCYYNMLYKLKAEMQQCEKEYNKQAKEQEITNKSLSSKNKISGGVNLSYTDLSTINTSYTDPQGILEYNGSAWKVNFPVGQAILARNSTYKKPEDESAFLKLLESKQLVSLQEIKQDTLKNSKDFTETPIPGKKTYYFKILNAPKEALCSLPIQALQEEWCLLASNYYKAAQAIVQTVKEVNNSFQWKTPISIKYSNQFDPTWQSKKGLLLRESCTLTSPLGTWKFGEHIKWYGNAYTYQRFWEEVFLKLNANKIEGPIISASLTAVNGMNLPPYISTEQSLINTQKAVQLWAALEKRYELEGNH